MTQEYKVFYRHDRGNGSVRVQACGKSEAIRIAKSRSKDLDFYRAEKMT